VSLRPAFPHAVIAGPLRVQVGGDLVKGVAELALACDSRDAVANPGEATEPLQHAE